MDKSVAVLILHNDTPPPKPAGRSLEATEFACFGTIGSARPEGLRPTRPDPAGLSTTATPPAR